MALFTSVRGSFPWNPMRTQCAPSVGHGTGLFFGVRLAEDRVDHAPVHRVQGVVLL